MMAVDTNVLVRFLVADDEVQAKKVHKLFKKAEASRETFLVPILVVLELLWVLESAYAIQRHEILDSLNDLMMMPVLDFESQGAIRDFIQHGKECKNDLPDLLIGHCAKARGVSDVLTFDRKASRLTLFSLLK